MSVAALIVAAGRGRRAGPGLPKQYRPIGGRSAAARAIATFAAHPRVDRVLTVIHPDDAAMFEAATAQGADPATAAAPARADGVRPAWVAGGAERQDSVRLGLEALAADGAPERVLIHDAARPFLPHAVIDRALEALADADGACAALPVADTLRRAVPPSDGAAAERCGDLVDRTGIHRAQTPQAFRFEAILEAHRRLKEEAFTDDAELARRAGLDVVLVEGAVEAAKLTTPADFDWAARWAQLVDGAGSSVAGPAAARPVWADVRVGQGFDVHKFGPNADGSTDHVMLCGIAVPHDTGLVGHSDADVGLHALTDALLGALGAGDIGRHFPPSDERWRGAPSDQFLSFAADLARASGAEPTLLDVTLICERPKIGPHAAAMRARIAEICGLALGRVSVKATTSEQLGFTGRREGIAALASATVSFASPPP